MQLEECAKIKLTSTPEGCAEALRDLADVFIVVKTSEIIKHREDPLAHVYATLIKKEVKG